MKNQVRYLQNLFYDLLNDYGRVYVVVRFSEKTIIGKRGFTEEEKRDGIILIFNANNFKDLHWEEDGSISTSLGFGAANRPEKCYLYSEDIVSVFSPDARVKYDRLDIWDLPEAQGGADGIKDTAEKAEDENIVSLESFRKTKK